MLLAAQRPEAGEAGALVLDQIESVVGRLHAQQFCSWINSSGVVSGVLTFADLWRKAGAVGFKLRKKLGLHKGDRIIMLYTPGLEFMGAFLGCLRGGIVAVPLYPPAPSNLKPSLQKLQKIVDQTEARAVLCDGTMRKLHALDSVNIFSSTRTLWPKIPFVDTASLSGSQEFSDPRIVSEDLAFLQFSSGSTSDPKGVMVSFGMLTHNIRHIHLAYIERLGLGKDFHTKERERGVCWLPHYHDMGLICGFMRPLVCGCLMTYLSPLDFIQKPHLWLQAISQTKAHVTNTPNFGLKLAARKWNHEKHARAGIDLTHLVFIQCAAEPIQPEAVADFHAAFARYGLRENYLAASYGLAENVVMVCADLSRLHCFSKQRPSLMRCGFGGHPDFDVRIVDPDSCVELPEGREGEIWVSSQSTSKGYWRLPEESARTFGAPLAGSSLRAAAAGGFLRTGDLGFVEEGGLYVSGRIKDLIIIRGQNLYPQDIEGCAERAAPAVRPGCVAAFAVSAGEGSEQLAVVLEVRADVRQSELQAVCESVAKEVTAQVGVAPARVVAIREKSIPKTTSGKIRRRQTASDLAEGKLAIVHNHEVPVRVARAAELGFASDGGPGSAHAAAEGQPAPGGEKAPGAEWEEDRVEEGQEGEQVEDRSGEEAGGRRAVAALSEEELGRFVLVTIQRVAGLELELDSPLMERGIDSLAATELASVLGEEAGVDLPPTLLFDCPAPRALARHLFRTLHPEAGPSDGPQLNNPRGAHHESDVAIAGMACSLPGGVRDLGSLLQLLAAGGRTCGPVPFQRWDQQAVLQEVVHGLGRPEEVAARMAAASFVDGVELFDPAFFRMSQLEAASMDPQQRMLLLVATEALLDAGYDKEALGDHRIGVFVGCSGVSLFSIVDSESRSAINSFLNYDNGPAVFQGTKSALSAASGRIAHTLGLRGPCLTVDTACSSSLVAMDVAKRYVLAGDCDAALVCTVNHILSPAVSAAMAEAGMTSPNGECHTWDASANGYGRGEGCCAVVLTRLQVRVDAGAEVSSGVYAIVRGSAIGHDGESASLSAPNGSAQSAVIASALADARLSPGEVHYLEAHGTGTELGDPIEIGAVESVLGRDRPADCPLLVNSIKANIGHLEASAGLAGVFAAVAVLHTGQVHPNAQLRTLNPKIKHVCGPAIRFPTSSVPLPDPDHAVAGVSSFGFTGTLAHVLLQAPPEKMRRQLQPATPRASRAAPVAWVFSGQGERPSPSSALLELPVYRAVLETCDATVQQVLGHSIRDILHPTTPHQQHVARGLWDQPVYAQPAQFVYAIALAHQWMSQGQKPAIMIGHSFGELACLCVAGAFSIDAGVRLACGRAQAIQQCGTARGRMVAVRASLESVSEVIGKTGRQLVSIAAENGANSITISGQQADIEAVLDKLQTKHKVLPTGYAFHSHLMRGAAEEYRKCIEATTKQFQSTTIPVISTVTGSPWNATADPVAYLTDHLLCPVRFYSAVQVLLKSGHCNFVEMGPGDQFIQIVRTIAASLQERVRLHKGSECSSSAILSWNESLTEIKPAGRPFLLQSFPLNRLQHRLLQRCRRDPQTSTVHYRGWLHPGIQDSWMGKPDESTSPFPRAAQLEVALATAAKQDPGVSSVLIRGLKFSDFEHQTPSGSLEMCVSVASVSASLSLTLPSGDKQPGTPFEIVSGADREAVFTSWRAREAAHAAAVRESEGWLHVKPCTLESSTDLLSSKARDALLSLRVSIGADTASATALLSLSTNIVDQEDGLGFSHHPVLLEAVMGIVAPACGSRWLEDPLAKCIPVSIDTAAHIQTSKTEFRYPKEVTAFVQLTRGSGEVFASCSIADAAGNLCLVLEGVRLAKQQADVVTSVATLKKGWMPLPPSATTAQRTLSERRVLVIGDLSLRSDVLSHVFDGPAVAARDIASIRSAFEQCDGPLDAVFLSCCTSSRRDAGEAFSEASELLKLVLELLELCQTRGQTKLVLVTHGSQMSEESESREAVTSAESGVDSIFLSMLWGVARVAQAESDARSSIVMIDADPALERSRACTAALADYWTCVFNGAAMQEDAEFLHRGGSLLIGRFCPAETSRGEEALAPKDSMSTPRGRGQGCYIVTGGTGCLGLMAARALVEARNVESVVLLSRSCRVDSKAADDLDWLKRQPNLEVLLMHCDAGDEASVVETLRNIRGMGKAIRGVVHAAGVLKLGRIAGGEALKGVEPILRAHVLGCWLWHQHTLCDNLELFVVLSSATAALPVFGCSVYAGSKAFQDELVTHRRRAGLQAYSMQLPTISGAGVADGLALPMMFQSSAVQISPEAFRTICRHRFNPDAAKSLPPVELFLPRQLLDLMRKVFRPVCVAQFQHVPGLPAGSFQQRNEEAEQSSRAPSRQADKSNIADKVLRAVQNALDEPDLSADDNLLERGMDSISSVCVVENLRLAGLSNVGPADLFHYPTVSDLLRHIQPEELEAASHPAEISNRPPRQIHGMHEFASWAIEGVPVPATLQQEGMYAQQLIDPEDASYNESCYFIARSGLRVDLFKETMQRMMEVHPALRTSLCSSGRRGKGSVSVLQVVEPAEQVQVPLEVVGAMDEEEARALQLQAMRRPFDLHVAPLLRVLVVDAGQEPGAPVHFSITMHHAIMDGSSTIVLCRHISECYNSLLANGASVPPRTEALEYADYAMLQRTRLLAEPKLRLLEEYWKTAIPATPTLVLQTDFPRTGHTRGVEGQLPFRVEEGLAAAAKQLCARHGCTLFHLLCGVYGVLLCRMGNEDSVVMGFPHFNRPPGLGLDEVVGMFANTLPVMIRNEGSVEELLKRARDGIVGAIEHGDLPYGKIVSAVREAQGDSGWGGVQSLFALQSHDGVLSGMELGGVKMEREYAGTGAKFDMSMRMEVEASSGLAGVLEYQKELFDDDTVKRVAGRFVALFESFVRADAGCSVSELRWLPAAEEREMVALSSAIVCAPPFEAETLVDIWERAVRAAPHAVAVVTQTEALTYEEADKRARHLMLVLSEFGVKPGDFVGLVVERCSAMIVGMIGIMMAGGAYVPIDPTLPDERTEVMLDDAGVVALVVQGGVASGWKGRFADRTVQVSAGGWPSTMPSSHNPRAAASLHGGMLGYMIYTSGSTGKPKGVKVHHAGVVNMVKGALPVYDFWETDRMLFTFSFVFDFSVQVIWLCFAAKAALVLLPIQDMLDDLPGVCKRYQCSILSSVPTLMATQSAHKLRDAGVRLLDVGGEAVTEQLINAFSPEMRMINGYGPTETSIQSHMLECFVGMRYPRSIGPPLPNLRCYVVDLNTGKQLPVGMPGELCIAGVQVTMGYHNRPTETAKSFVSNPFLQANESADSPCQRMYRTGDLCRWLPDGSLDYLGRCDRQVKIRGYRIEPGEIEQRLRDMDGVEDAAVLLSGKELVGFIVPASVNAQHCLHKLKRVLPPYMVPSRMVPLDGFPLTPNNKLDSKALLKLLDSTQIRFPVVGRDGSEALQRSVPLDCGFDSTMDRLLGFTRAFLDAPELQPQDNLFQNGLDSITAIVFTSQLREKGLADWTISSLLRGQTLAELHEQDDKPEKPAHAAPETVVQISSENGPGSGPRANKRLSEQEAFRFDQNSLSTILLQAFGLVLQLALLSIWLFPGLVLAYWALRQGKNNVVAVLLTAAGLGLGALSLVLLTILLKWLLVGKQKPGVIDLWNWEYFAWWFAHNQIQMVQSMILSTATETFMFNWWLRALGAKVGSGVVVASTRVYDHDLVALGDNVHVHEDASLSPHFMRPGKLVFGRVCVGHGCVVGPSAHVGPASLSHDVSVPECSAVPPMSSYCGLESDMPPTFAGTNARIALGWQFLNLIVVLVLQIAAVLPSGIVARRMDQDAVPLTAFLVMGAPLLSFLCFGVLVASLGRLLQPLQSDVGDHLLRRAFASNLFAPMALLEHTPLVPMYLRLIGAKVGKRCMLTFPRGLTDFTSLDVGDDVFTGSHFYFQQPSRQDFKLSALSASTKTTVIGDRTMITNHVAVVPPVQLADCTIGDATLVEATRTYTAGTITIGHSTFPRSKGDGEGAVLVPDTMIQMLVSCLALLVRMSLFPLCVWPGLVILREASRRIQDPYTASFFFPVWDRVLAEDAAMSREGAEPGGHWYAAAFVPVMVVALALTTIATAIVFKWTLLWRFREQQKVAFHSVRYSLWEGHAILLGIADKLFLRYLKGSELLCFFFRAMGAKVGKNVSLWLDLSLCPEFDLFAFGDGAVLGREAVLQGHLVNNGFVQHLRSRVEQRGMVHAHASLLCGSTIRENGTLGPASLLLSGEEVAAGTAWAGRPAAPLSVI